MASLICFSVNGPEDPASADSTMALTSTDWMPRLSSALLDDGFPLLAKPDSPVTPKSDIIAYWAINKALTLICKSCFAASAAAE